MISFWIVILATLAGCFFTSANYALIDYSRARLLELLTERLDELRATRLTDTLAAMHDGLLLLTSLLRTICNFIILFAMIAIFAPPEVIDSWWNMAEAFVVAAVLIAIFGIAIPLSVSRHGAERLIARAYPLLRVLHFTFQPVLLALHLFDPIVRRLLGVPAAQATDLAEQEQDILDAVSEGEMEGVVDEQQKEMIEAVVEFPSITVDQIMVPRTDIHGVDIHSSLEDVKKAFAETGHSRMPVFEDDLDHILGVLYVKDLIALLGTNPAPGFDLRKHLRQAVFVPESKTLRDLLGQFKASKVHMAIVLDEYGGTSGLVTIEDIVEEIVGEIQDEYEKTAEPVNVKAVEENVYEVSARTRVAELNDELQLQLPEDEDYDTVGGFVLATLGRIPVTGDAFTHDGLRITVTEAEKTRVNTLRIEITPAEEQSEAATESE